MENRLSILYIIPTLKIGGSERQLLNLVNEFKAHYRITVCCLYGKGELLDSFVATGVEVVDLGLAGIWDVRVIPRFLKVLLRSRYAMLHAFLFDSVVLTCFLAKLSGVPIIISSRRNYDDWMRGRHIFTQRLANFFTDKVTVNARKIKEFIMEKEKLNEQKIAVIYNGIDVDFFHPGISENGLRQKFGIQDNTPLVGTIASFKISKGHTYLLDAISLVRKKLPDAKFLMVGEGHLKNRLERKINKLGIAPNLILAGRRLDSAQIISMLDIFVLSSIREGQSNAILEAMALGKPVIATDVGGNTETVMHGVSGYLVPPRQPAILADRILELLEDKQKALAMGKQGRIIVSEKFNLGLMAQNYTELYNGLLAEKGIKNAV